MHGMHLTSAANRLYFRDRRCLHIDFIVVVVQWFFIKAAFQMVNISIFSYLENYTDVYTNQFEDLLLGTKSTVFEQGQKPSSSRGKLLYLATSCSCMSSTVRAVDRLQLAMKSGRPCCCVRALVSRKCSWWLLTKDPLLVKKKKSRMQDL